MNVVREIERINEQELKHGIVAGSGASWHDKYSDSAWVFVGGLDYSLTEGDVLCVMSQWGEIEDINMVRDAATGKSKGFAFVKYEDQRSTVLAVDNFNGIKLLGRTLRVDHVEHYKLPKHVKERESEAFEVNPAHEVRIGAGHAYEGVELASDYNIKKGIDLWAPAGEESASAGGEARQEGDHGRRRTREREEESESEASDRSHRRERKERKEKKEKKEKKHKEKKHKKDKKRSRDTEEDLAREFERRYAELAKTTRTPAVLPAEGRVQGNDMEVAALLAGADQSRAMPAVEGGSMSWRGHRDPALAAARLAEARRKARGEEIPTRREETDMYGGFKRRR